MHLSFNVYVKNKKFGLNICGEGGEYETFTLDCPLFKKRIVMYVCHLLLLSFRVMYVQINLIMVFSCRQRVFLEHLCNTR